MKINPDKHFMQIALNEALLAFEKDEVPIGAVVVCKNQIIGRGHNLTQTLNDVTAHAEMLAITAAANNIGGKYLDQCTLYVTLEPCVMCAGAMFWAQLGKLVYAASDPKRGFSTINKSILHSSTIIEKGVLERECSDLLKNFFKNKR
jgi:tRNA(adenine34) deaminase